MDALECIKGRRSVREFKDTPVSKEVLESVIDTARFAPSWKNTQISRYVALTGDSKKALADTAFEAWIGNANIVNNAPMVIVQTFVKNRSGFERDGSFSTSKEDRWQNYDCGIAAEAFCLAAYEKGLGSVIMGIFDEDKVAKVLNLSDDQGVAAIIAIGYPVADATAPKRKEVADLLTYLN
ncbi:MAG: nitroreductase family protein [Lachnospiraceae bacterium]|jgi:nitroreductase|nr:nitroreductase family protein [Lachnospiraceae bacterium]MBR5761116.1 nitroreductase family protein [Lachnospiraceae bacterium]MBR5897635.1 nitroreductase family protein [Lachnospiraceae bacterium]